MSQLKVLIKGIAICHFDPAIQNWRVFVPRIEDEHNFRVSVIKRETGVSDQVIFSSTVEPGSKIVLSNDSLPATGDFEPIYLEDNFDLTKFHGETIPLKDDPGYYAAFVTLPGFPSFRSLMDWTSKLRFYRFIKIEEPTGTIQDIGGEYRSRDNIFTKADPANGSRSTLLINNESAVAMPHTPQIGYEVIFDNDCDREHNPTAATGDPDFKFYYNIIDISRLNAPCRFKLEPVEGKCDVAGCSSVIATDVGLGENLTAYLNN